MTRRNDELFGYVVNELQDEHGYTTPEALATATAYFNEIPPFRTEVNQLNQSQLDFYVEQAHKIHPPATRSTASFADLEASMRRHPSARAKALVPAPTVAKPVTNPRRIR